MSTRNPLNERYTSEEKHGVSRKSAASAKPKTKAAATVYIKPKEKTPQEKKAARREARRKEEARQQQYYNPDTPTYKKYRRIWWVLLACAIAALVLSWFLRGSIPELATYIMIGISYAFIIAAFVLEFTKVRKERQRYAEVMAKKTKENRAAEKKARAEQRAQKAEAAEKFAASQKAEVEKKKSGFFGRLCASKGGTAAENADAAADGGAASTDAPTEPVQK